MGGIQPVPKPIVTRHEPPRESNWVNRDSKAYQQYQRHDQFWGLDEGLGGGAAVVAGGVTWAAALKYAYRSNELSYVSYGDRYLHTKGSWMVAGAVVGATLVAGAAGLFGGKALCNWAFPTNVAHTRKPLHTSYTDDRLPPKIDADVNIAALQGINGGQKAENIDVYATYGTTSIGKYGTQQEAVDRARSEMYETKSNYAVLELPGDVFEVREITITDDADGDGVQDRHNAKGYDTYSIAATNPATRALVTPQAEYVMGAKS